MQEYKRKTNRGTTTQDVTHRGHAAVAGCQCSRGIKASICPPPIMWQLGKMNGVVFRIPRTKVLGFQSGVPKSSDK